MNDQVYSLLVDKDEISWKVILLDLISKDEMDPWDVDISILTKKYIDKIKQLKNQDLKLSGKVLLAAAILLRIKSKRLVGEDLNEFDRLLASTEEQINADDFYSDIENELQGVRVETDQGTIELMPHMPLPRKRKVSVFDLVKALETALEVKHRRLLRQGLPEVSLVIPESKADVRLLMKRLLLKIKEFVLFTKQKSKHILLTALFSKTDKPDFRIRELLALLHLATARQINIDQNVPFGDVEVTLNKSAPALEKQKTLS